MSARRRSTVSFPEVVDTQLDFVWTNLARLGIRGWALEDAVHDVFVELRTSLPTYDGRLPLRTWLFSVVRRAAARRRRTPRTRGRRGTSALAVPHTLGLALVQPAQRTAEGKLRAVLDRLESRERDAFILGEIEGMGRVAIGNVLGISPNAAHSRLSAARRKFTASLAGSPPRETLSVRRVEVAPEATRARLTARLSLPPAASSPRGVLASAAIWFLAAVSAAVVWGVAADGQLLRTDRASSPTDGLTP